MVQSRKSEIQKISIKYGSFLAVLVLGFIQGYLLLKQLSLPLNLSKTANVSAIVGLSSLSIAFSYGGRAIGIYFSGVIQKYASLLALITCAIAYGLFSVANVHLFLLGALFFGISTSATNIFTRRAILSINPAQRSNYFFYILFSSLTGMWITLFHSDFIIMTAMTLGFISYFLSKQIKNDTQISTSKINWRQIASTFSEAKLFSLKTGLLILMASVFNASIFVKLKILYPTFDDLLLRGLALVTIGVLGFQLVNYFLRSTIAALSTSVLDLIYIGITLFFFFSNSIFVTLIGIPLAYCLSQFTYLNLLRESESKRAPHFSIFYEVTGFLVGIAFFCTSFLSPSIGQIIIVLPVVVYGILVIYAFFAKQETEIL